MSSSRIGNNQSWPIYFEALTEAENDVMPTEYRINQIWKQITDILEHIQEDINHLKRQNSDLDVKCLSIKKEQLEIDNKLNQNEKFLNSSLTYLKIFASIAIATTALIVITIPILIVIYL